MSHYQRQGGRPQLDNYFGGNQQLGSGGGAYSGGRGRGRARGGGRSQSTHTHGGGQRHVSGLCTNFTMTGVCRFGAKCRYQHTLRNVGLQADAHDDFIYCVAVGAAPPVGATPAGSYEIYTGGRDKQVKRWLAVPERNIPAPSTTPSLLPTDALSPSGATPTGPVNFVVKLDVTTPFEAGVTSLLLAAECLFCGLSNGSIRGFHRPSGSGFHLTGHTREVQALSLVDGILISGDFGGQLMFWKPELTSTGSPNFVCAQKLIMPSPIRCIKDVIRTGITVDQSSTKYFLKIRIPFKLAVGFCGSAV
eukprot:Gregarina_sp_Poly_1__9942@NODE_655_length_6925_cov_131_526684_g303_i1_p2_GENE_NODE_655_length_6925_cov_131_526684_g303_i1NODE_655_length_6925_cov_131_526684_g303_i1_p2_ORF_typecomplete_len305_score23_46zfCCCH/PF00642_24/7_4e06WD40/PF00400_32/0_19WD40/PF00400_32/5_4zfCCCH_4/PF18044_1/0_0003Torus/PF16131_5/0_016zf_CCCH_4/PF18345_1/0_12zfCCCH_2/PF14608_6/0_3_NODE_655_length_6925_cov_131_526684_g303_i159676881